MNDKTPELLTEAELKLLRRVRGLHAGNHLAIIQKIGAGVVSLSILTSGKVERLDTSPPAPLPKGPLNTTGERGEG